MEAKKRLARTITASFHGEDAALAADENWVRMFQQKGESEDLEEVRIKANNFWTTSDNRGRVAKLITLAHLSESSAEADRKLKEGAVRIDGEVINQTHIVIPSGAKKVIRVGKRAKIVRIYFPSVGERVKIDSRQPLGMVYVVESAVWGEWATVRLLDPQGNPTGFTERVPPGDISPA
jgi:tyrosyl-tRNA synthetase